MPRPDPRPDGPVVATAADVPAINRLFSDAFTDRYRRDGLAGVRVPPLNPAVWRYAIAHAGEGALLWHDAAGLAAFNMAHASGEEGWMGPLAVRPERQGQGLGAAIVRAGVALLRARGASRIGLETMPRTVDNIGFYARLGFMPGHLTLSMTRAATAGRATGATRVGRDAAGQAVCRELTARVAPGLDFTRELELTAAHGLGDATLLERAGQPAAFALWHDAALAEGRAPEDLRVLKLVAEDTAALRMLLDALGAEAAARGLERVTVRAEGAQEAAFGVLVDAGFRVQWTDLRMTLPGTAAARPRGAGVVFSNWEL